MNDQVSNSHEKAIKAVVVGPDSSETENKKAPEGKYNLVFTGSKALSGSHQSMRFSQRTKSKLFSLMKCIVHFIFTLLESYQLYYF